MSFIEFLVQITSERSVEVFLLGLTVLVLSMTLVALRRARKIRDSQKTRKVFSGVLPAEASAFGKVPKERQLEPKLVLQSNAQITQLIDIEEALLALRELYIRKLIDSDLYVRESMKHAARLNFVKGSL